MHLQRRANFERLHRRGCFAQTKLPAQELAHPEAMRQRLFREESFAKTDSGQVFWLPDLTSDCTFPRHSAVFQQPPLAVAFAAFVPGYSGGTATDSHRLPYSSRRRQAPGHPCLCSLE